MATAAIFSSLRRRRSPSLEAFLAPVDLTDVALVQTLASVSVDLISSFSHKPLAFQRKNSRSLIRKIEVFVVLLEFLKESRSSLPSTGILCFKELYLLLYRSKILLDYCSQSSKLWLLLQSHSISGHFHDLDQEISTLLDVFPLNEIELSEDVREQIELLQKQLSRAKLFIDKRDEMLRLQFFSFLDKFEKGEIPDRVELQVFFVERLGIKDVKSCRAEIEFLEEQIYNHEGEVEPTASVLNGFVALTRYCRFLLFGFEEDEVEFSVGNQKKLRKGLITQEIADTFLTIPKDFCCPISLDLMQDPVIISTGQTYDRDSISRWMEEGHYTCPKTGQMLAHSRLVPNRALRNLILQWCTAHGIPLDPPECTDSAAETFAAALPTKAALEANRATASLLIQQLASGNAGCKDYRCPGDSFVSKNGKGKPLVHCRSWSNSPSSEATLISKPCCAREFCNCNAQSINF
ncbi:hypothetical protein L1049_009801 [Liquidambar formosana]|uniref:U-box domain-containing protein n=1 Tax=Liquidambar formosana TaxID=63359 RepID=A0AAP0R6G3_LIQFO